MNVLAIESSCDETAASIVVAGEHVLSNVIASQIDIHRIYGGVVPEIASRAHVEKIESVVQEALKEAGLELGDIDRIAVTRGPGLLGCLLVGVEFAKALSVSRNIPLVSVHHIAGHLYSPYLGREVNGWGENVPGGKSFDPYIGIVISGGHTSLVKVHPPAGFEILGETLDDAVGEAYDKVAKHLGLGYPGGPIMDQLAAKEVPGEDLGISLPRPMLKRPDYEFSFSGLKTAFATEVEKLGGAEFVRNDENTLIQLCKEFQEACIEVILTKAKKAMKEHKIERLAIVGGVACNKGLRRAAEKLQTKYQIAFPAPEFCTDNAAMIAGLGAHAELPAESTSSSMNASASLNLEASFQGWKG